MYTSFTLTLHFLSWLRWWYKGQVLGEKATMVTSLQLPVVGWWGPAVILPLCRGRAAGPGDGQVSQKFPESKIACVSTNRGEPPVNMIPLAVTSGILLGPRLPSESQTYKLYDESQPLKRRHGHRGTSMCQFHW